MNFNNVKCFINKYRRIIEISSIVTFFLILTSVYLFPMFQGLILLPLDLLISNYLPWYSPGTILIKNNYTQDAIIQMYPWRHLVFQSLTNGIIPFWNPYQFMGTPFLASLKPLIFYPTNIFFVFGEITSWNMLLFLQIFLSLLFFYLLARDFKLSYFSSILSSFAFALNSLMMGFLQFGSEGHVILWIPLFLLFAKRYADNKRGAYLFLLGVSIAFSIFAGHLQFSAYGILLVIAFILFYGYLKKLRKKDYLFLFLSIAFGALVTSISLIPAFELFSNSHREFSDKFNTFAGELLTPIRLFRLFSPDFFGSPSTNNLTSGYIETSGYFGIIPLFFAIFASIFSRKNIFVKFFTFVFILSALFSFKYIGDILFYLKIPLITNGSGARLFMLSLFSGSVLAGFGFDNFIKDKNRKKLFISILLFVLLFAFIIIGKIISLSSHDLINEFIHNVKFTLAFTFLFFVVTSFYLVFKKIKTSNVIFIFLILLITFTDLFVLGYRFLTFSNNKFLYPETKVIDYIKDYQKNNLVRNYGISDPEISTYLNIYSTETYNPLYLQRTALLLQSLQGKKDEKPPSTNKYYLNKQEKLKNTLDILGVELIVGGKDGNPSIDYFLTGKYQKDLDEIYADAKYKVYKNKNALKRFYLVYDYEVLSDNKSLSELSRPLLNFNKKIILSEKLPILLKEGTGSAFLIDNNINQQKFKVNTNEQALFYMSDTYFPGWNAKVNGKDVKIYKANYNFRAIIVPKGESTIEFNYLPSYFYLAVFISCLGFIGLLLLAFLKK